jgi:hypothetical protein
LFLTHTARAALESVLTQRANYVELTAASAADPAAVIESAALAVKSAKSPATVPGPVHNLSLTAGDNAGELDLQWDPTADAARYEPQLCATSDFTTGIIPLESVSKSKTVAKGLVSGTRIWARVRAGNPAGMGGWSDVATKIVP